MSSSPLLLKRLSREGGPSQAGPGRSKAPPVSAFQQEPVLKCFEGSETMEGLNGGGGGGGAFCSTDGATAAGGGTCRELIDG